MYRWSVTKILAPWFLLLAFTACGTTSQTDGNNDMAGGGIGGTGISVGKITAAGSTSVDVNGVAFDTTNATVTVDGAAGDQNNLKVGMIVKVDGTFNPDLTTGTAANIEFKDILEGPVDSVDLVTNSIVVFGQTVIVDSATHFHDFSDSDSNGVVDLTEFMFQIYAGNVVEVSGYLDVDGIIYASYISLKSTMFDGNGDEEIELKGTITDLTALDGNSGTFKISGLTIVYSSIDTELEDITINELADGLYVEVKSTYGFSGGALIASKIELEDQDYHFKDNDEFEVEGYVTALLTDGQFKLGGQTVQITAATQYNDGGIADIKVNTKLEVEGTVDAFGVLVADKIKIESVDNSSEDDQDDDSDHDSTDSLDVSDDDSNADDEGGHDPS